MNKITIFNQKGGVGKSAITVNLSAVLCKLLGKRILVVDCDAQANTSSYFLAYGYDNQQVPTLIDYVNGTNTIEECIHKVYLNVGRNKDVISTSNIDILPVDERLDNVDFDDALTLKKALEPFEDKYDYCFFDCSPQKTSGVILALCASDYVLVPMDSGDIDSVQGWNMVLNLIDELKTNRLNDTLRVLGIVVNFYNRTRSVHSYIMNVFRESFKDALFNSTIRDSADIEQAKIFRKAICYYKPSCMVTRDYESLAIELNERVNMMNKKVGK